MKSAKSRSSNSRTALLQPCSPEGLQWDIQQIQLAIARRAYELFETRNREHGHDWEDWFQAESELLRPVSIAISETADRFSVRANVLPYAENELKVSVEPRRLTIVGNKGAAVEESIEYPEQLLRLVELPADIDPASSFVELQSGVLKFELPKATKAEAMAAGVAKA